MIGTIPRPHVLHSFDEGNPGRITFMLQEIVDRTGFSIKSLRSLRRDRVLPVVEVTPHRILVLAGDLEVLFGDSDLTRLDSLDRAFMGQPFLTVPLLAQVTGISINTWDRIIREGRLQNIPTRPHLVRRVSLVEYLRERRVA